MQVNWKQSIYSDGSKNFVSNPTPELGETVEISLRVLSTAPVDKVFLRCTLNGGERVFPMRKTKETGGFTYYSYSLEISQPKINYHFYLTTPEETYYYNQLEVSTHLPTEEYDFCIIADYNPPEWVKSTVFYQIFPDRFYNGNPANDVADGEYKFDGHSTINRDWNEEPGSYQEAHCLDFFGGDLEGIKQKISYLQDLGATALYLNPIFYAATHHKYDCLDYFKVDPHLGGDEALIDLVEELHDNDMKIMLDTSVNHTGTAHKWFNKEGSFFPDNVGAYNNPEAEERKYYYFYDENTYHGWNNVNTLPTLNYQSEALRDKIYRDQDSVLKYWLQEPFNIDGWRLDVASVMGRMNEHQMHHQIWPEIRTSIREENSDAYLLGEHWTDDQEFLQGDEWDSAMNYFGFGRPVRQFVGELDLMLDRSTDEYDFKPTKKTAEELADMLLQKLARLPHQLAYVQFNLLDSHDTHRLHNNPQISWASYRGAVIMLFSFLGTPNIYYGDEVELDGRLGSHEGCRYPMEWEEEKQNQNYYHLYKKLAHLKQTEEALQTGGFKILYAQDYVISYARFTENKVYLPVVSQEEEATTVTIPVGAVGVTSKADITEVFGKDVDCQIEEGLMKVSLEAEEALLFEINLN